MENNNIRKASESFGSIPKSSEGSFGSFRKENHTLTVRDVLKLFETKGVDITERSIVNYCHPNKHGVCLLDSFFDENERKFFITPESVERAIPEIKARKIRMNLLSEDIPKTSESSSESFRTIQNDSESNSETNKQHTSKENNEKIKELERKAHNLDITNQVKDKFIEQLQTERNSLIETMREDRTLIGELKTKLLQLESPKNSPVSDGNNNRYRTVEVADKNTGDERTGSERGD